MKQSGQGKVVSARGEEREALYTDLRDWIRQVEEWGELKRISRANRDLEIGAIAEIVRRENPSRPALLFEDIPGFPDARILTGMINSDRRLALTLNLPLHLKGLELVKAWKEKSKTLQRIPCRVVKEGPVLENVYREMDVNLLKFPSPKWHEKDGGRYLGTANLTVTRDPDDGWINAGTYRVMVHDERTLGFYISPGKHGRIHRDKYFAQHKPCPVVVSFGHDPLLFLLAATQIPYHVNEFEVAGGIREEPIEVIEGEHTGLPFPASSEIVIEGEAIPGDVREEGPFGEFTGYYASGMRPEPVIRVKALMHRNGPIICSAPPGLPPGDSTFPVGRLRSALIWKALEGAGVPDVVGVWCHEAGCNYMLIVVSICQRYPGHAKQAGVVASQCHGGAYLGRYVIVVDKDIDPSNITEVLWALATRSDPASSMDILRRCWSGPLDPIIRKDQKGFNSRAIIEACRPFEWKDSFPEVAGLSPELRSQVKGAWSKELIRLGALSGE